MTFATIKNIANLEPIDGADNICAATVEGWTIVVKKGDFTIGDRCVYIEIDTVVPDKPEFEFLRARHFRIKTIRLKGCLSQGLVLPLSILPPGEYLLEQDVTELVGVTKYERPVSTALSGLAKGNFPSFIPKTDEPLLQSHKKLLEELNGLPYYITTKLDGTSVTFYFNDEIFGVCSRNLDLLPGESVYWRMAKDYGIEEILRSIAFLTGKNLALQGEIVGPSIQKNRLKLTKHALFIFNIFDIDNQRYFGLKDMLSICKFYDLPHVPIEETGESFSYSMQYLINEKARGRYSNTENSKEGIVVRPQKETYSRKMHGRLSFKVLNNEFLEKEDK